jgi:tRNA (guanine-N7-)-methyltransferase
MRSKLQAKELVKSFETVLRVDSLVKDSPDWNKLFDSRRVSVEIGMGKGRFVTTLASERSDEFFLGLEVKEERVLSAAEKASDLGLKNVRFLLGHADDLGGVGLDDKIDTIYLNFSDPWPKKRHVKRRLTCPRFLEIYKRLMVSGGRLVMKTDNEILFDYSLEVLPENGWKILTEERDHKSRAELVTEFEQRFLDQNLPIYYLDACRDRSMPFGRQA